MKNIFISTLILILFMFSGYTFLEPQEIFALEDQITVTQSVTAEITITSPANVTMSPSIVGITGNPDSPSAGYAQWTIATSNNTGFTATFKASSTDMVGDTQGDSIQAYTEAVNGVPDYTWSVATNAAEFGYNATTTTAADLDVSFKSAAGSSPCNAGSVMTNDQCWLSASTSPETLINRTSETTSGGVILGIKFQVEIDNHFVSEDTYTATTTVTATVN